MNSSGGQGHIETIVYKKMNLLPSDHPWYDPQAPETTYNTEDAKRYNGAYAGYQPKPAVEVVIVAMKPRSEKTYVDQCLANGHGITYLDDCRIPIGDDINLRPNAKNHKRTKDLTDNCYGKFEKNNVYQDKGLHNSNGRFPANLLVSDDSLNDGKERKSGGKHGSTSTSKHNLWNENEHKCKTISDSGSYSRYFDLDAWFAIIPKPSKKEKNQGLEYFEDISTNHFLNNNNIGKKTWRVDKRKPDGGYYVEVKPTKNQNIMFIVCAPYITHHHTLIQTDQKTLKTIVLLFFH